ncbi:P-type trefoil, partial [Striga asiatica]
MSKTTAKDQARTICRARFDSASRAALACAIVGLTALYGPTPLVAQIKFLPFSYLVLILTLSNNASTLGHSVRGFWHILFATIQVVPIAAFGWWLAAPAAAPPLGVAAVVAAVAAFLVVLPRSTHVTAKRIALAQITLVCTELIVGSDDTRH